MKNYIFILACFVMMSACQKTEKKQSAPATITKATVASAMKAIGEKNPGHSDHVMSEKGIRHAASLWRNTDGTPEEFIQFCTDNYIADAGKEGNNL